MAENTTLRVAVIGLGVGVRHADGYAELPGTRLVAVCDQQYALAMEVAARHGCAAYAEAERMFQEQNLHAVSVCTPPATHAALTESAASQGVHVFVEKPIAPTEADAERMIEACRRAGVKLMVGHKKRFAPPFVRLRELTVADGELGAVRQVTARYVHGGMVNKEWFWLDGDGGGPLLENHVHAADTLGFLVGRPLRVYAEGASRFLTDPSRQLSVAAYAARFQGLPPGRDAIVSVGYGMVGPVPFRPLCDEYWLFACERGVAEVSGPFDNVELLRWARRGSESEQDVREERWPGADLIRLELDHFLACVRDDRVPQAGGEAALDALRFCLAVKESALKNRTVEFPPEVGA